MILEDGEQVSLKETSVHWMHIVLSYTGIVKNDQIPFEWLKSLPTELVMRNTHFRGQALGALMSLASALRP